MARSPNPHYQHSWNSYPNAPARQLVNFAQEIITAGVTPSISLQQVTLNGFPEMLNGSPAEVSRELEQLSETNSFDSGNATISGPDNRPQISVSCNFGLGHVTLILQNADANITAKVRDLALTFFPESQASKDLPDVVFPLQKGQLIDNYRLIQRLGRGQSAEVWKAIVDSPPQRVQLKPGETVAIKVYLRWLLEQVESIRIQREFKVASEIKHPSIVRVYDNLVSTSRGYAFLVMEYLDGDTLSDRIPRHGMPFPDIVQVGKQLFNALEEIHSLNALHRDLKAANIILTSEPSEPISLKVLDFGIVEFSDETSLTGPSVFLGSKHSAPLEQLTGKALDERADIYAAGSVLYHCYTGSQMYDGVGTPGAIVQRMLEEPVLLEPREGISGPEKELVNFINKCLQVDASNRPSTGAQCLEILNSIQPQIQAVA